MASPARFDNLNYVPGTTVPVTAQQAEFDNLNVGPGAPGLVTGLTATVMGSTAIALQWTGNTSPTATSYSISAVPALPLGVFVTTGKVAVFTGLTPSTAYVFSVVPVNSAGNGVASTVTATTLADQTGGGTNSPPPVVTPPVVIAQPTGQAFPAGYAFRTENFGKTASQVTV